MICTVDDDFVKEKLRWVVKLSDGTTVYQDDNRPGMDPPQAWIRLGQYAKSKGLHISEMKLQFRSHIIPLPKDCAGYFFSKKASGFNYSPITINSWVVGILDSDIVKVVEYRVPELIAVPGSEQKRDPKSAGLCLIKKEN